MTSYSEGLIEYLEYYPVWADSTPANAQVLTNKPTIGRVGDASFSSENFSQRSSIEILAEFDRIMSRSVGGRHSEEIIPLMLRGSTDSAVDRMFTDLIRIINDWSFYIDNNTSVYHVNAWIETRRGMSQIAEDDWEKRIDVHFIRTVTYTGLQKLPASNVNTSTANFTTLLSSTDIDVQLALDTLDKHEHEIPGLEGGVKGDIIIRKTDDWDELNIGLDGQMLLADTDGTGLPVWSFDGSKLTGVGSASQTAVTIQAVVNEGAGITKGTAVYISGASGGYPQVSIADNTTLTKADVIGIAAEAKADAEAILIRISGEISGCDTSLFLNGDLLYVNSDGSLTKTKPTSGRMIPIAYVSNVDASNGKIVIVSYDTTYIGAANNEDIELRMGDAAGATKIEFEDNTDTVVASLDSNGNFQCDGTVGAGGQISGLSLDINSSAAEISSSGDGTFARIAVGDAALGSLIVAEDDGFATQELISHSNTRAETSRWLARRSRGTGLSPAATVNLDPVLSLNGQGYSSGWVTLATVELKQDGASGTYIPGKIEFGTATASAAASPKMTIGSQYVGIHKEAATYPVEIKGQLAIFDPSDSDAMLLRHTGTKAQYELTTGEHLFIADEVQMNADLKILTGHRIYSDDNPLDLDANIQIPNKISTDANNLELNPSTGLVGINRTPTTDNLEVAGSFSIWSGATNLRSSLSAGVATIGNNTGLIKMIPVGSFIVERAAGAEAKIQAFAVTDAQPSTISLRSSTKNASYPEWLVRKETDGSLRIVGDSGSSIEVLRSTVGGLVGVGRSATSEKLEVHEDLSIWDSGGTDYLKMEHDGNNAIVTNVGGQILITPYTGYPVSINRNLNETLRLYIQGHDSNDACLVLRSQTRAVGDPEYILRKINTGGLQFTSFDGTSTYTILETDDAGLVGIARIPTSYQFEVKGEISSWDSGETDWIKFGHDGTQAVIEVNSGDLDFEITAGQQVDFKARASASGDIIVNAFGGDATSSGRFKAVYSTTTTNNKTVEMWVDNATARIQVGSSVTLLDINTTIQPDGYNSADGTAGLTTSHVVGVGDTFTIKNGLITAIT